MFCSIPVRDFRRTTGELMKQYLNRLVFKVGCLAYLGKYKLEEIMVNYLGDGKHVYCLAESMWWYVLITSMLV